VLIHFRIGIRVLTKTEAELAQWFADDPECVLEVAEGLGAAHADFVRAAKLMCEAIEWLADAVPEGPGEPPLVG
jgi:hypothetical protein